MEELEIFLPSLRIEVAPVDDCRERPWRLAVHKDLPVNFVGGAPAVHSLSIPRDFLSSSSDRSVSWTRRSHTWENFEK